MGPRRTTKGRGYSYTALEPEDAVDDVLNISDDEESDPDVDSSARNGRKKWQSRLKVNSSLVGWVWNGGLQLLIQRAWNSLAAACQRGSALKSRTVSPGQPDLSQRYPANVICNRKYSLFSFIPKVLFEQFRFILNLYFLVFAVTQFVPQLKIGYLYSYWGLLIFVLVVTMVREVYDDIKRYIRDKEVNVQRYYKLTRKGQVPVASSDIQVSDVVIVEKDQRVPADMVLLRTTEKSGSCFVRTDQLDGETEWKLRVAVPCVQALTSDEELFNVDAFVFAERPQKCIYSFVGTLSVQGGVKKSLGVENTLWANTVLASGTALGLVIYTGAETRSVLNTSGVRSNNKKVPHELSVLPKEQIIRTQGGTKHIPPTPVHNLKNGTTSSYEMTPADPITQYENYSIGDLSSNDSRDEENSPKKPIPDWAHHTKLNKWMEKKRTVSHLDVRLDNVCFHNDTVTLIDFDRSQSVSESSELGYRNSFMYTFPEQHEESERSIKLLDWKQLGMLIFSIMHGKTQTDLKANDFKSETGGTLVASLVHKGVWNADLAKNLSKEKTIQECFKRCKQS